MNVNERARSNSQATHGAQYMQRAKLPIAWRLIYQSLVMCHQSGKTGEDVKLPKSVTISAITKKVVIGLTQANTPYDNLAGKVAGYRIEGIAGASHPGTWTGKHMTGLEISVKWKTKLQYSIYSS